MSKDGLCEPGIVLNIYDFDGKYGFLWTEEHVGKAKFGLSIDSHPLRHKSDGLIIHGYLRYLPVRSRGRYLYEPELRTCAKRAKTGFPATFLYWRNEVEE